jgi:catechol 2,3-dioxygenase-like lactoylglutathione lyase family enzyme
MISAIDYTSLVVSDLDKAVAAYRLVLGRETSFRTKSDGSESAFFTLDNATLRIVAPAGEGLAGDQVRAILKEHGEGLSGLNFRVDDIGAAHRRLRRLSMNPDDVTEIEQRDEERDAAQSWKRTNLPQAVTHGVDMSCLEVVKGIQPSPVITDASVEKMDLVVVSSANPERAAALYGARLGLDLVFDRTNRDNGGRLMQFVVGDMMIEVASSPSRVADGKPDAMWGIAWSVADADAARARLAAGGRNVSDVKTGAKPGTRVFTLRDGTCNVPTLFVQYVPT